MIVGSRIMQEGGAFIGVPLKGSIGGTIRDL